MLRNYLKIAWRSLLKDKQFTVLNILGLSAGLACSLLIFLWVDDELSVDRFFANDERLYRLMEIVNNSGQTSLNEESSGRLSEAVKQSLPEVEYAAAIAPARWFAQNTLSVKDKHIKAGGQYAEKDFFNIFSFELPEGDRSRVLESKSSIVVSDELAIKLFGTTTGIIGKPVEFDHDTTFYVSGIFKKLPSNSTQQFDFVLSFEYFKSVKDWVAHWNGSGPQNFVLLKKGTDITAFNNKVRNVITANTGDTTRKVIATRFSDGYLYNQHDDNSRAGGRIEYVNLFSALAVFILLIACINFMNLSTAKAARRLKEIGIKKVVGARRSQLIFQFLTESFLLTVFAMVIAGLLAAVLLTDFNQLTGKSIELSFTWKIVAAVVGIAIITGFLAGSYPALYISGFKPLAILKGKLKTSTAELLSRKGLVVFQFTLSTILIIAVMVIYQQVQFIKSANLGYNKEDIVRFASEGAIQTNQEAFLSEMRQIPGVVNAGYTFHSIVGRKYSDLLDWQGKDPNRHQYFEVFGVSHNFVETMDMQMKAGRGFSTNFSMDSLNIIINEAAAKVLGLKEPVGAIVRFHGSDRRIIGVVRDFHFESMHEAIKPAFMHLQKGEGSIVARIKQENQRLTLTAIENLYKRYNPGFPFTFNFLNEAYQKQYATETRTASLSGYFAGLAIIISCLGLFGLAAFTAQKRQKEIGIRKVIGASIAGIIAMLSKDFLKLVGIALLIAFPISWWMMSSWLQSYTYRISLSPMLFLMVAMLVLAITFLVIGFQTIKAAIASPVKSLRTE
ncbi:ABC transporter permease [Foetidibacter luteolus]|uniref:ABC transporter permease n=1 Tax=Foetidibacter luteolus TaxID=2608880 RepID=UPI00129BA1BD|nr:ABC transporter permease [Foetidibacter luteolus]